MSGGGDCDSFGKSSGVSVLTFISGDASLEAHLVGAVCRASRRRTGLGGGLSPLRGGGRRREGAGKVLKSFCVILFLPAAKPRRSMGHSDTLCIHATGEDVRLIAAGIEGHCSLVRQKSLQLILHLHNLHCSFSLRGGGRGGRGGGG